MKIDKATEDYYTKRLGEDPGFYTRFPNLDNVRRWAKVSEFLTQIATQEEASVRELRILDVGCNRGWLTKMASIYGHCEGVEPVAAPVALARKFFPGLTFHVGTTDDLLKAPDFKPFDVVICSEVIEHIPNNDKHEFVASLRRCLVSRGHLVMTTPRGEWFTKYARVRRLQPVEDWLTEKETLLLFRQHGFVAKEHDRAFMPQYDMSLLQRLSASGKIRRSLSRLGLEWLQNGLQYSTAIYQVWWFQLEGCTDSPIG